PSTAEAPAGTQATPARREEAVPKVSPQPQRRPAQTGERTRTEDLSRIRQRIAAKMMESLASSAQLTTVQEADLTRIMRLREQVKEEFKTREGVTLSPFVFLCRAAVLAIRNHPKVNADADWNAGKVTFHEYVNLGIAVDTDKGLLVPNVKGADDLSLAGLARAINEVAGKARGKGRLEMTDIEGGTFTVTNTGSVGVLIDTPILNYPEVAILGTGAVRKRASVIEDDSGPAIAIRDMAYLSLTYDHRLIDGADAARFVTEVKQVVETHDWAREIGYGD
nr:2-oxo acid dehydrogenase subunit E2 [Euzebyales bacterium]